LTKLQAIVMLVAEAATEDKRSPKMKSEDVGNLGGILAVGCAILFAIFGGSGTKHQTNDDEDEDEDYYSRRKRENDEKEKKEREQRGRYERERRVRAKRQEEDAEQERREQEQRDSASFMSAWLSK